MLESKIEELTNSVKELIQVLKDQNGKDATEVPSVSKKTTKKAAVNEASELQPVPSVINAVPAMPSLNPLSAPQASTINAAPGMPPLPSFLGVPAKPTPAAVIKKAPFTNNQGLIDYAVSKFHELGEEKSQKIQSILESMGLDNISDMKPESYDNFYSMVEEI